MSIIRATRQKGGYSSDHKATSYGGVTDEPAFKPKGKQEQQQLISWKNQRRAKEIYTSFICTSKINRRITSRKSNTNK